MKIKYTSNKLIKWLFYLLIVSSLSLHVIGCDGKHNKQENESQIKKKYTWQDEVKLQNGQTLWVDRTVELARRKPSNLPLGTVGVGSPIQSMRVTLTVPENPISSPPPVWSFNAVPLLLDYDTERETWFVVASFFYCNSWEEAGRPALDKWQYEVENNQWVIKPLNTQLVGRIPNLMIDFGKGNQLKKATAEEINKNVRQRSPDNTYRIIKVSKQLCNQSRNFKPGF